MTDSSSSQSKAKGSSARSASSGSSTMAQLLASYKNPFKTFHRGDIVEGKITKLTRSEMLVDIQAKSEALVIEKDKRVHHVLMTTLKVGDTVSATVINPESEIGIPLVSLRRFVEDKAWDQLAESQKNHKMIEVTVTDATKGGYVVVAENGLSGFLPHSHTTFQQGQQIAAGRDLQVSILELNRGDNKIIFSQKTALSKEDFDKLRKQFEKGQKLEVAIANIAAFGIFVTLPLSKDAQVSGIEFLDGLIHISEIAWEKTTDITEKYSVGDTVEAVVIGYDAEARRIDLSIKRLTTDPFAETAKEFPLEKRVSAPVTQLVDGAVHVELAEGVEGIVRKEKVPPNVTYTVGQTITATVSEIDNRRHKIYLTPVLKEKPIGYR